MVKKIKTKRYAWSINSCYGTVEATTLGKALLKVILDYPIIKNTNAAYFEIRIIEQD